MNGLVLEIGENKMKDVSTQVTQNDEQEQDIYYTDDTISQEISNGMNR